jgi:hypothetical protein
MKIALSLFFLLVFCAGYGFGIFVVKVNAQSAAVTQAYGLTLERDDFPPATAGQTTFSTAVSTRSNFALFFRNGLLQRPCTAGVNPPTFPPTVPVPCDYALSGNVTATYGAGIIQAGDLVTIFFYR